MVSVSMLAMSCCPCHSVLSVVGTSGVLWRFAVVRAAFHKDAGGEARGDADACAEHADDERVTALDQLQRAPGTDTHGLEPAHVVRAGVDTPDHRTLMAIELVERCFRSGSGRFQLCV